MYVDMVLVHGVGPGVERIAANWAERNDDLLNLLPKGIIAFPGSGITDNLVDKAVKLGIPIQRTLPDTQRSVSSGAQRIPHRPLHERHRRCAPPPRRFRQRAAHNCPRRLRRRRRCWRPHRFAAPARLSRPCARGNK